MQDIKFKPPVIQMPVHKQISLGGSLLYAPGTWGAELLVGDTVTIEVVRRSLGLSTKPILIAIAETNPNGEFMMIINSKSVRVGKDLVFLWACDKASNERSSFHITYLVNWQL